MDRKAGSGRSSVEVKCQNADCAATLDISAIPVEYKNFLDGMASLTSQLAGWPLQAGEDVLNSPHYTQLLHQFKHYFDSGDRISFTIAVAQLFFRPAGTSLPLCEGCMHSALATASKVGDSISHERDYVVALLTDMENTAMRMAARADSEEHVAELEAELAALNTEEQSLQREVEALERQLFAKPDTLTVQPKHEGSGSAPLAMQLQRLRSVDTTVNSLESQIWCEFRRIASPLRVARQRMSILRDKNVTFKETLSKMRYLTVHSDALFIWHRGPFVTINNCRIGRLPGQPVEWAEINAALGHVAMLIAIIANRVNYKFSKYQVIPMGSFSCISPTGDEHSALELHWVSGYFREKKFNNALKAMLSCISELGEVAMSTDRSFWWPHAISASEGKIADLPITIGGKDTQWTRAMKCALTNLKWLLAWAYRQPE